MLSDGKASMGHELLDRRGRGPSPSVGAIYAASENKQTLGGSAMTASPAGNRHGTDAGSES